MSEIQEKSRKADVTQSEANETDANQASIHKLNDDCLHKIFMELSIAEHMRIERVCKRWQNVSQEAWPDIKDVTLLSYKHIWILSFVDSSKHTKKYRLRTRALEKILIRCGRFLTHLHTCNAGYVIGHPNILPLIAKHCYNLTKLTLQLENYPHDDLNKLFSRCQKLKFVEMLQLKKEFTGDCLEKLPKEAITELHLDRYSEHRHDDNDDTDNEWDFFPLSAAEVICKFSNLHTLELKQYTFKPDTLKLISEIQTLTNVSFEDCKFRRSIRFLTNLRNLERLSLYGVPQVSDEFLSYLATNCTQLKHLDISCCKNVSDQGIAEIAKLPQIESLVMCYLTRVSGIYLGRMTSLKTLDCIECLGVFDNGIVALIENAPNLEYLTLYDTNVTEVILKAADRVTRRRKNGLLLKIFMTGSMMGDYEPEENALLGINEFGEHHIPSPTQFDNEYYDCKKYRKKRGRTVS